MKKYPLIMKMIALNSLLTGCVMRGPKAYTTDVRGTNSDGTTKIVHTVYYGNAEQFTLLGNCWNGVTYGTIGMGVGAYYGLQRGFDSTNSVPYRVWEGASGIFSGAAQGICKGTQYGYNLDYDKGRSVEGRVLDSIEYCAGKVGNFMINPFGRE